MLPLLSQAATLGVLYPEVREPYHQVYASIVEGIEGEYKQEVRRFVVTDNSTADSVRQWVEMHEIDALVVLGNQSLAYLPEDNQLPVVVGGTILKPGPESLAGITLNPSPSLLFGGLLKLKPSVTDIHVVYEPDYNEWVVAEANKAAEALDLTLHGHPVSGMRQAAAKYREVQGTLNSDKAALWLPLGGPSRESSILQTILQKAWSGDQIVISSNLSDVRRGALYALYPNNREMGRELAKLLKQCMTESASESEPRKLFLSSTFQAVNLRTAEHIGLRLTRDDLKDFEFVYPPL
ncbi:MAG: hypothetical protein WDZ30_00185 [Cellvibrionaceae bacterium]